MLPGYQNGNFLDIHGAGFINDTEEQLDDKLDQLDKNQLILFNYCSEHYGPHDGILRMYDQFVQHNLNFILLYHDNKINYGKSNILFYPYWYFYSHLTLDNILYIKNVANIEKKFAISCLNGNPRFHRIHNYILLMEKPYFKDLLFSFYNADVWRHDDFALDPEIINKWNLVKNNMPSRPSLNDKDIAHEAYSNSYINFVTESTVLPKLFITEKTWKPIASGQLFLIFGNMGTINYLREQGIDTFDDLIDHNYYDNESDWNIRLAKIHTLLDKLMTQDLYHLNKITQTRRSKNAENFFAGKFGSIYLRHLEDKIKEHVSIR